MHRVVEYLCLARESLAVVLNSQVKPSQAEFYASITEQEERQLRGRAGYVPQVTPRMKATHEINKAGNFVMPQQQFLTPPRALVTSKKIYHGRLVRPGGGSERKRAE